MNWDLIKQYFFVLIRYATPYITAWLVTAMGITTAEAANIVAAAVTMLMFVWSLANKTVYENKVNTALEQPKGTSKEQLKDVIAEGKGEGSFTAK